MRTVIWERDPLTEVHHFDCAGRLVRLSTRGPDGKETYQDFNYDPTGNRVIPGVMTTQNVDGSRTEVDSLVRGFDSWTMAGLHGSMFPTSGAATAQTVFDHGGVPFETRLLDHSGQEMATITYVCDDVGRIQHAFQHCEVSVTGSSRESTVRKTASTDGFGQPQRSDFRFSFLYDTLGRLARSETYIADDAIWVVEMSYNEYGDLRQVINDDRLAGAKTETHFRYEYDQQNNWVVRESLNAAGTLKETRRISYYDGDSLA